MPLMTLPKNLSFSKLASLKKTQKHRWFVCDNGDYNKNFTRMTVVYVSTSAKKLHHQSTDNMEKTQISRFKGMCGDKCMNKAPGGEGASDDPPHFCYVVSM